MARRSRPRSAAASAALLLVFAALAVLALAPAARAASGGGLAGDECDLDSECMSRQCGGDQRCEHTTCGLPVSEGGVGPTMPLGYCTSSQFYNPDRVCTFGYGKCAKAECCDTLSCGVGVDQVAQGTYCPPSQTFAPTRLCPNGVCTADACCVQTRCDSAGGVAVDDRSAFCASGEMFNNAGLCPAGEGNCTADDCCVAETRTCEVAFADSDMVSTYGLTCASPSVLVPTRLFDANDAAAGGCCETRTCGMSVPNPSTFCASTPKTTVFSNSPACAGDACTISDCCLGACDGDAVKEGDGTCSCAPGKSYLHGAGCVCSPGTQLVNGACSPCPYGTYSALPTAAQTCTPCPADEPYTSSTGADSADRCINYCDQALLNGSGACSNGGVCATLSGDPGAGGSFTCTCPAGWMGYGATATNNCDAPSTLLRLRVLAASDVTLPADFALSVADAPAAADDPSYALIASPAGSLACSVTGRPTTPTVPTCSAGGAGALSAALGSAADTRKFVQTKVKLSTNYGNDASYAIGWACSDGTQSDTAELAIVLPGPANTKGAMTLVCTAVVGRPVLPTPVKLQLADGSVVPAAADASTGPAQLTFVQGARPICTLPMPASSSAPAAEPQCAANDQPFESGKPGALGVANVDTERYTVLWTCAGAALMTSADGGASTPNLPSPGQPVLVCAVRFAPKTTQLQLAVTSTIASDVKITVTQTGMNDACVATIPVGANKAQATLACPSTYLASGATTVVKTDADLTKFMVSYTCKTSVPGSASLAAKGLSITTTTTRNGDSTPTSCNVVVAPLPPLLRLRIDNTVNAPLPGAARARAARGDRGGACSDATLLVLR
jgi:hypothetical protein